MIMLLGGALAGFFIMKSTVTPAVGSAGNSGGATKTTVGKTLAQTTNSPSSAVAPRANQGNQANQPWYQGPAMAAGGVAASTIAKGVAGLFTSSTATDNTAEQFDDEDLNSAEDDYGLAGSDGGLSSADNYNYTGEQDEEEEIA